MNITLPKLAVVRQPFPASPPIDVPAALRGSVLERVTPGARIAVAVGSRGVTNLATVVTRVVAILREAGARPFIIPAMGSHGGATPEGQRAILEGYGVTGPDIHASMDVERLGATPAGTDVWFSAEALRSDGIVLINRVKPHTNFGGTLGSGIVKMIAVGLGKQKGAAACHAAVMTLGYEPVIRALARVILGRAPILCGVALVEDAFHQTARIEVLPAAEIEAREVELLADARSRMARLPFDAIDLLIVDRIGKDVSGSGMDPNVIDGPKIRRIFVRDLTPQTRGNAIGIGLADFTTSRLVRAMDHASTYMNALTSLSLHTVKIPIHFETDRESIERALESLVLPDAAQAKVVRIQDTLSLETLHMSEACPRGNLQLVRGFEEMRFDDAGVLL